MAPQWLRRASRWLAACAAAGLLASCGSGSIESQLSPSRLVAFGDAFADQGQNGARYTINDGTVNNWTTFVATAFGRSLSASSTGGLSYATGNARVLQKPDAAGNAATPTVKDQIDTFLAANSLGTTDLVIVNAGTSDVIVQAASAVAGTQTRDQMLTAVGQAGRDLGAQVRRLVQAGANHVVVVGPYNLGRSPWGVKVTQATSLLEAASSRFNEQLLVSVVDLGANVLYVDAALYFNLVTSSPASYDIEKDEDPACNSVDPGPGIGTGTNQVNSNLCNTNTLSLAANVTRDEYLFADRIYPTPRGHRLFGEYAFNRIRERW
ncbi:GDSL family lipase [Caenimonas sedimenti]|uniref:GDSL family lipase n=1 Tax=Caenimonas sedimenti TaxID=2596921 RepID=A0A562ZMV1_9BURK|nr:SGNH/GDSL hydrolase family protein [Caenimonas sedimenti]TWO69676.1 GDSL family lipase [Caenimonas sedimenti]